MSPRQEERFIPVDSRFSKTGSELDIPRARLTNDERQALLMKAQEYKLLKPENTASV
jgi:hypothetical protein